MAAATPRIWIWTASIAVTLLALAGCGHSEKHSATSGTHSTSSSAMSAPSAPPDPQTLLRAAATAVKHVPGGTLIFIQSETDDMGTWKTRVVTADGTEQQVKVGSDGYSVLVGPTPTNDTDTDTDKAQHRGLIQGARLDYQAAVTKVLAAVPDGSIGTLRLDDQNGTTMWDADVWDTDLVAHKVVINATSGELVSNKQV
jgi:uncharacterized membrane protein YkoI